MKQEDLSGYVQWSHLIQVLVIGFGIYLAVGVAKIPVEVTKQIPFIIVFTSSAFIALTIFFPIIIKIIKMGYELK